MAANDENFTLMSGLRFVVRFVLGALLFLPLLFAATGCTSIGPSTVTRDRFDYGAAVGDSWKTQMLLNLVKMRYGDIPVFLDVGQVVAGYSVQKTAAATASIPTFYLGPAPNATTSTLGGLGMSGTVTGPRRPHDLSC